MISYDPTFLEVFEIDALENVSPKPYSIRTRKVLAPLLLFPPRVHLMSSLHSGVTFLLKTCLLPLKVKSFLRTTLDSQLIERVDTKIEFTPTEDYIVSMLGGQTVGSLERRRTRSQYRRADRR